MIVLVVALIILFHVIVAYAIITRRINALYILAGAFCFAAPVSTATVLPFVEVIKYGRVYLTLMIIAVGILLLRLIRFGPAAVAFMCFISLYALGAFWSDAPLPAIAYKGLFFLTFLSGVLLANSTRDVLDLRQGVRILAIAGAVFAIFVFLELVRNPAAIGHVGRLYPLGINPNRVGHTIAPMFILATFLGLYDPAKSWRIFGFILVGASAIIILYTGARGAAGMAAIGAVALFVPKTKQPVLFLFAAAVTAGTVYFGLGLIEEATKERLGEFTFETRWNVWGRGLEYLQENYAFGQGWVYLDTTGLTTENMHSIYMQTLSEIGLVGITVLAVAMVFVGLKAIGAWRLAIADRSMQGFGYLLVGFLAAIFAHGVVESATFVGTTVNAVMLGWSVAMIDRLPVLLVSHWNSQLEGEADWDEAWNDDPYAGYADGYLAAPQS